MDSLPNARRARSALRPSVPAIGDRARRPRRPEIVGLMRRAVLPTLAAVFLLAGPAAAHPFVPGGEVPVDSLAKVTLAMAHGCGSEDSGGGDPTTEIALEVPARARIVEVPPVEGFEVELETDEQGRTTIVTWRATTSQQAAPEVFFDAVFAGEPGDEVHLKVFQGCPDFTYRWIGTPDEPAEDPAVAVTLAEPDPDRPPPEPTAPVADDDSSGNGVDDGDDASDPSPADGPGGQEDPGDGDDGDPVVEDRSDTSSGDVGTTPSDEEAGPALGSLVVGALVVLLVLGAVGVGLRAVRRRGGRGRDA